MADDLTVELTEQQALSVEMAESLTVELDGRWEGLTDDSGNIIID